MSPHAPRFHLISGNRLDVLAADLGARLAQAADPLSLAPDVVLIPQPTLRQWLQQTLAERYGIAANLDLITPSEFVWRLLRSATPGLPAQSPWDRERVRWRLYALLRDHDERMPVAVREYLRRAADDDAQTAAGQAFSIRDALARDALADALAGAFDKYQAYRRDWLQAWERGEQAQDWQATLWRMLCRAYHDAPHRAALIGEWLARYAQKPQTASQPPPPPGLPPRLSAFGTIHVSPDVLRMLAACAHWCALDFYLPTPSSEYWGDVESLRARLGREDVEAWPALLAEAQQDNPLLQAWGTGGRDIVAQLFAYDTVQPERESERFVDPGRDTLLHRLQQDVLRRAAPAHEPGDGLDGSLQIHACHSKLREVEVLHDRLRAMLDNDLPEGLRFDPPLKPHEIAVMAPNIADYLPLARAVFGGIVSDDPRYIPFSLADRPQANSHPLVEWFLELLMLPETPITSTRFREWLALPALARTYGLDAAALAKIDHWFDAAGIRWGDDARVRARLDAGDWREYSFAFGFDRLLAGYAAGDAALLRGRDDTVVAPFPDLEGGDAETLDAVLRFHGQLQALNDWMRQAHDAQDWQTRMAETFQTLLPPTPTDAAEAQARRDVLEALAALADEAQDAGALPVAVVRRALHARLQQPSPHRPWLAGGVVFAGMVPLRTVPFRVICLLGMDAEAYPRRESGSDINRLIDVAQGRAPRRLGDRSVREDDRFLFLQLLCAADDVLYLSYGGRDARDGSVREPASVVAELLDVVERMHGDGAGKRMVLEHPLQPFSPRAYGAGEKGASEPRRFSYRSEWHLPPSPSGTQLQAPSPFIDDALPPPSEHDDADTPDRETLQLFFDNPARAWLRERLGLRLPTMHAGFDAREADLEPMGRDALLRYHALDALLSDAQMGLAARDTETVAAAQVTLRARGILPPGRDGDALATDAWMAAQRLQTAATAWRSGQPRSVSSDDVPVATTIEQVPAFRFDDVYDAAEGVMRVVLSAGKPDGKRRLHAGIDHLLLALVFGEAASTHLLCDDRQADSTQSVMWTGTSRVQAWAGLRALIAIRRDARARPLPFAPKAAFAYVEALAEGQDTAEAWHAARKQFEPSYFGGGEAEDPWRQLAFRPQGWFADFDSPQAAQFRDIATRVFAAVGMGE